MTQLTERDHHPRTLLQTVPIDRRERLSVETFMNEYLSGCGRPVVVTDALAGWNALATWSFDFFRSRYGSDTVVPSAGARNEMRKVMKLADYIDSLDAPDQSPGFWIDPINGFPLREPPAALTSPLCLRSWNAFLEHPELHNDVALSPVFAGDMLPLLPDELQRALQGTHFRQSWLFIGPQGSLASLHQDFLQTHGTLAQIVGRKKCTLFSPGDADFLYDGKVDVERPDFQRFPLLTRATAFECVLEPGELLFIPGGWWHQVIALDKSITASYSFVNRANCGAYLAAVLRELPAMLDGLDRHPEWRAALGIRWVSKGFDYPDSR